MKLTRRMAFFLVSVFLVSGTLGAAPVARQTDAWDSEPGLIADVGTLADFSGISLTLRPRSQGDELRFVFSASSAWIEPLARIARIAQDNGLETRATIVASDSEAEVVTGLQIFAPSVPKQPDAPVIVAAKLMVDSAVISWVEPSGQILSARLLGTRNRQLKLFFETALPALVSRASVNVHAEPLDSDTLVLTRLEMAGAKTTSGAIQSLIRVASARPISPACQSTLTMSRLAPACIAGTLSPVMRKAICQCIDSNDHVIPGCEPRLPFYPIQSSECQNSQTGEVRATANQRECLNLGDFWDYTRCYTCCSE